ncbi:MAG TPA: SIS domain-containing protein [Candidatus Binatia bacterium]|nr:SIS domain-containing protein [Candidatus Binatia bacterium]
MNSDTFQRIETHLLQSAEIKRQTAGSCAVSIANAAELIARAFLSSGKLLLCGNGGSAADCQHMAAEFVSRFSKDLDRRALPAIALTTDTSFLTAFGNDCGFEGIFERQIEALGSFGDLLIAISTSGNSPNVIRAVEAARKRHMGTIALTGNGGHLSTIVDVAIAVPSGDTQYIQETHLAVEHILCELVESVLFRKQAVAAKQDSGREDSR